MTHKPELWTPEREAELTRRWGEGASAGIIAKAFGLSRDSVIGKVRRLKLPKRVTTTRKPSGHAQLSAKYRAAKKPQKPKLIAPPKPIAQVAAEANADLLVANHTAFHPLLGSMPVPLVDLEDGMCKWPVGDAPMLFCGLTTPRGAHYCMTHRAVATRPPNPADKARDAANSAAYRAKVDPFKIQVAA